MFLQDVYRCLFVWKAPQATTVQIARADAIVTMTQGLRKDGTPSRGDMLFADVMRKLHEQFPQKPIIPQEPVALAAPDISYVAVAKPPEGNTLGGSSMAWNTRTVTSFQAEVCWEHGWKTVALIAAPWTQTRAKWELERCGLKVVVVPMPPYTKELYGDPNSIYWYCRGGSIRYLSVEGTRGRAHYLSYWLEK